MDAIGLARQLVDIESTTGREGSAAEFLAQQLEKLGYAVERMAVAEGRFNVCAAPPRNPSPALFSRRTSTRFLRSFDPVKTTRTYMAEAPATPKESSLPKWPLPRPCDIQERNVGCCL